MNNNTAPKGLRGWWASPPRTGIRNIIAPWEYRHLRGFARLHIAAGVVLAGLGLVTVALGGGSSEAGWFALVFLAGAAAHMLLAAWLLNIARSEPALG